MARKWQSSYVFTAQIGRNYQLADDVTQPTITITVTDVEADEELPAQTVTITIAEQDSSASLYFMANKTIDEATLLDGISAEDEQGNDLDVMLDDLGGLDLSDPQYQNTSYILTYAANHPISGETFTATREV